MEQFFTIVGALGVGSLISVLAQSWFNTRSENTNRLFAERKEAYIGFLEAWRDQDIEGVTDANRYQIGHWHLRSQLVASTKLKTALDDWMSAKMGSQERSEALDRIKSEMRLDMMQPRKRTP